MLLGLRANKAILALSASTSLLRTSATATVVNPFLQCKKFTSTAFTLSNINMVDSIPTSSPINPIEASYKPFLLSPIPGAETMLNGEKAVDEDWTANLDLEAGKQFAAGILGEQKLKVLVLYGSLRERSYSKLMAYEASRILHHLGCEVRVYDPLGLPVKDDIQHQHPKVQELRYLSNWSNSQFWCSPEQHGAITAVMKNQIDWIPLSTGSVRPTQGRTLAFAQVNGGSQSFNTVNTLRLLGRWMRMTVIPNQSSLPMAWKAFTPAGRLMPSGNRDRLVDVCEELVKMSAILLPHFDVLNDRWSEREETRLKGRLLTQAEKEKEKDILSAIVDATTKS